MSGKPGYKKAWSILTTVSDLLREEEDAKGEMKNNGEARCLNYMKMTLEREISKDATDFLKQNGFTGGGNKPKRRK